MVDFDPFDAVWLGVGIIALAFAVGFALPGSLPGQLAGAVTGSIGGDTIADLTPERTYKLDTRICIRNLAGSDPVFIETSHDITVKPQGFEDLSLLSPQNELSLLSDDVGKVTATLRDVEGQNNLGAPLQRTVDFGDIDEFTNKCGDFGWSNILEGEYVLEYEMQNFPGTFSERFAVNAEVAAQ